MVKDGEACSAQASVFSVPLLIAKWKLKVAGVPSSSELELTQLSSTYVNDRAERHN